MTGKDCSVCVPCNYKILNENGIVKRMGLYRSNQLFSFLSLNGRGGTSGSPGQLRFAWDVGVMSVIACEITCSLVYLVLSANVIVFDVTISTWGRVTRHCAHPVHWLLRTWNSLGYLSSPCHTLVNWFQGMAFSSPFLPNAEFRCVSGGVPLWKPSLAYVRIVQKNACSPKVWVIGCCYTSFICLLPLVVIW